MRYTSSQNLSITGETVEVAAKFLTGETVTVTVYDMATGSIVTTTTGTASEIGSTGFFVWGSDDITTQPTSFTQYLVIFEDGTGQQAAQKVVVGGFPDESAVSRYQGAIHIDLNNGTSGTAFPIGTTENPVDNESDARTIANNLGLSTYNIIAGTLTLTQAHENWSFRSSTIESAEVNVNGQDVSGSSFSSISVTGTMLAPSAALTVQQSSKLEDVSGFRGSVFDSVIRGNIAFAAGETRIVDSTSGKFESDRVVFDLTATGIDLNIRQFWGHCEVQNLTGADDYVNLDLISSDLTIDSTCTDGFVNISGVAELTDNSGPGCTVTNTAFSSTSLTNTINAAVAAVVAALGAQNDLSASEVASAVWNAVASSFTVGGSMGELENLIDDIQSQQARTVAVNPITIFAKHDQNAQVFVKPNQTAKIFVEETSP